MAIEGEVALFTAYVRVKARLVAFRGSLAAPRRALTNVPVLTTMGAHEAASGWNATRAAATKLIGAPAGRRVPANALSAPATPAAAGAGGGDDLLDSHPLSLLFNLRGRRG